MEFRKLFEKDYAGYEVILDSLVKPIFGGKIQPRNQDIEPEPQDAKFIKNMKIFATHSGLFSINFVDVTIKDNVKLEHNRVTVQRCVRKLTPDLTSALIFFHYENTSNTIWRITFVNKGEKASDSTNPKRYTYLCGNDLFCRTADERFSVLKSEIASGNKILDELMINAFSVESIGKEFFDQYREHYADLVEYISGKRFVKKNGKFVEEKTKNANGAFKEAFGGDDKAVRDYVKKMMGRLVFLQFLQKKGWLGVKKGEQWGSGDKNFIYNLFHNADENVKKDFLKLALEPLFFNSLNNNRGEDAIAPKAICDIYGEKIRIPYLNGGLFEEDELDKKKVKFKKEHFEALLEFFNQYNFTIDETDPDDTEIGVDPEMLGKIFENLLEDNKDKGAFYTPKEIVQYMCQESLIAYLVEKLPEEDKIRKFVLTHEHSFTEKEKADIYKALLDVKICDPAVGSGAFPMGMLNELLSCSQALVGDTKTRAELKKHIVKNNIYGVDIEKGAVDIARLRFWLAIIVDEENPLPLPNLDYKIMQGNSLLESFEGQDLSKLTKLEGGLFDNQNDIDTLVNTLNKYFETSNHEERDAHRDAIKAAVIDLLDKKGFSSENNRIKKELEKIDLHENNQFFLWHTWFSDVFNRRSDCNGFDIVIGNPPYIKEYENKNAFDGFRDISPYYMGKMDLWYGFACHGLDLLCKKGHLCFIAQNNWTTSAGAKLLRKKILETAKIKQLLDFNTYMVFENASIQTMIMLFQNNTDNEVYDFDYRQLRGNAEKTNLLQLLIKEVNDKIEYLSPLINKSNMQGRLFTFSKNESILNLISRNKVCFNKKEIAQGIVFPQDFLDRKNADKLGNGFSAGDCIFGLTSKKKEKLNLTLDESNLIKPYYNSEQIEKYYTNPKNDNWMIYTDSTFKNISKMKAYPNIKAHIDQFASILTSDNKPYGLHRAREERFFIGEKIISQRKCVGSPLFSYSNFDCFVKQTYFAIKTNRWNMKFLTGILNSRLIAFWLRNKGKMQGENYQVDKEPLLSIPLPEPTSIDHNIEQEIINLVDAILERKANQEDTKKLEEQIDSKVYELYGLTEDEIKIIES